MRRQPDPEHVRESLRAARALARLRADIVELRRTAALPAKNRLYGNAAVSRATDRFLNDLALAPIDNKQRNRLIDHAAGALVGACQQCFQALEAARPIPSIRLGDTTATRLQPRCSRSGTTAT